MRYFKTGVWIFIIFLIQTVILARVHVFSAMPSVVLPFVVCVMLLDDDYKSAWVMSLICAFGAGALCGREFIVQVLFTFYTSLIVFALRKKPLYIGGFIKGIGWTFILSGIMEIIFLVLRSHTLTTDMLLYAALPTAIINAIFVFAIYPVLKWTMYKDEKKKLLIGDII